MSITTITAIYCDRYKLYNKSFSKSNPAWFPYSDAFFVLVPITLVYHCKSRFPQLSIIPNPARYFYKHPVSRYQNNRDLASRKTDPHCLPQPERLIANQEYEFLWRKFESVRILIFDHKNTMNNCAFWGNDVIPIKVRRNSSIYFRIVFVVEV